MAAINGQVAASGLVGALTSVFVGIGNKFIPDGNLKSLLCIIAGISAAIAAFEILAWIAVFRLSRQRVVLASLIPSLEQIQDHIQGSIARQVDLMRQHNAPASNVKEAEKAIAEGALEIAKALSEIQKRSIDIVKELGR